MIDPRLDVIRRRLQPVERIIAVSSAKGGVGKSVCAALCSSALRRMGLRAGLLDLDFQGASAHLLLNVELRFPDEEAGIKPLRAGSGVDFMSFAAFSRERPVPLRGEDVTQAMLELLAITIWNPLDVLLIDMPPGIGDEILDALRYLERPEFLVVATPSRLVLQVVERLLLILTELKAPVLGLVENMAVAPRAANPGPNSGPLGFVSERAPGSPAGSADGAAVAALAEKYGTKLLGSLPFEPAIDEIMAAADPLDSSLGRGILEVASRLGL